MIVRAAAILAISLVFGAMAEETRRLRGVVVDESGAPVAEAWIHHAGMLGRLPSTDLSGRFEILTSAPLVVIAKQGFQSLIVLSGVDAATPIVLRKAAPTPFPECRAGIGTINDDGPGMLRFRAGPNVEANWTSGDVDYRLRVYAVRLKSGEAKVRHGAGPTWSFFGRPFDDQVWEAASYRERTFDARGIEIVDVRGRSSTGRYWRVLGMFGETATYETERESLAIEMDRLLDSACVRFPLYP